MSDNIETILIEHPGVVSTKHWHRLDDDRLQCDLCPRECKLRPNQRGMCFVRAATKDEVVLTTYGRSSGFCIDPIEKKPLNHFLPGTPVLSFGTAGCNLACRFCQNADISKTRKMDKLSARATPEQIARAAAQHECRSVAFTYNDPIIFHEYAIDVAQACAERGVKSVAVTAGYVSPAPRAEFFAHMDAANIDLKAFTESFYKKLAAGALAPVLDTLLYVEHETNVWYEITNLLIPGENDSASELEAMCAWIVDNLGVHVPIHFSAFHPNHKMLDKQRTPHDTLTRARKIARDHGIRYAYTGNVHDVDGDTTLCSGCGEVMIGRDWYEITTYNLTDDGLCKSCGAHCQGVFEGPAGNWGRKRQPIAIGEFA